MDLSTPVAAGTRHPHPLLSRWPAALGLLAAVSVMVTGADRETLAIVVSVAALCYLGAAALNRRWVAWAGIAGGSLVVAVAKLVGVPWWAGVVAVAVVLVVTGLFGGVPRRPLTVQAAALLAFVGLAVIALFLDPRVGLALAGTVLASHAGWDLVHYRRDEVVSRSLAEFCMLLDLPLGLALVVVALTG